MNSNLLKVLQGQEVSGVPVILSGAACAAKMAGTDLGKMRENAEKMVEVQCSFQAASGMDWNVIYADAYYLNEAFGCQVEVNEGSPSIIEAIDYDRVIHTTAVDFSSITSCKVVLDALELMQRQQPELPVAALFEGPFTTATRMFGTEDVLMKMMMEPETVKEALKAIEKILGDFAAQARKKGASLVFMPDPMSSRNMISPSHYMEFAQPYQTGLIQRMKSEGLNVILHICGDTKDRWQGMADTQADALSLDQIVNFTEVRRTVGEKVVIAGNVDPINTLLRGDAAKVALEAEVSIARGGPKHFILMPGCGTPPGTPVENTQALVQAARKYIWKS